MEWAEESEDVSSEEKETTPVGGACYAPAEVDYQQLVENSDFFLDKLRSFHSSFGTNFSWPSVGGTPLDLHELFVEVTSHGGIEQVVKDRKWQEVVSSIDLPIEWSFALRKYYMALLYHFEQVYFFKKGGQTAPITAFEDKIPGHYSAVEPTEESHEDSSSINHSSDSPELHPGVSLVGIIDEKFDNGYVVSVNLGCGQLKGILYHISDELQPSWSPDRCKTQRRRRKKPQLTLQNPSESTPTGSSFSFCSEHHTTPMPVSQGQEYVNKDDGAVGHIIGD